MLPAERARLTPSTIVIEGSSKGAVREDRNKEESEEIERAAKIAFEEMAR